MGLARLVAVGDDLVAYLKSEIAKSNGSIGGEQSALTRQTKRATLVKKSVDLRDEYLRQNGHLIGKGSTKAARHVAAKMGIGVSTVYDYWRAHDGRN